MFYEFSIPSNEITSYALLCSTLIKLFYWKSTPAARGSNMSWHICFHLIPNSCIFLSSISISSRKEQVFGKEKERMARLNVRRLK